MLTMWRQPGDVTNVPRFGAQNNPSPWASQFLEDASYLKLKVLDAFTQITLPAENLPVHQSLCTG